MEELPAYYLSLFNAVSDAIVALDQMNFGQAKQILIKGQQNAEELYLSEDYKLSMNPLAKSE